MRSQHGQRQSPTEDRYHIPIFAPVKANHRPTECALLALLSHLDLGTLASDVYGAHGGQPLVTVHPLLL